MNRKTGASTKNRKLVKKPKKFWVIAAILAIAMIALLVYYFGGLSTPCGGVAGIPCAPGYFCKLPPFRGISDEMGTCVAGSGSNIAGSSSNTTCGGIAGIRCSVGYVCKMPPYRGISDDTGTCVAAS